MTSYDAWLDTDEVKRLAGQLLAPAPSAPAKPAGDPSFGADFVGFEAESTVAGGPPGLTASFVAADVFVRAADGTVESSQGEGERWAGLACGAVRTPVRLKVSATEWLELIPLSHDRVLGVLVTRPLASEEIAQLAGGE